MVRCFAWFALVGIAGAWAAIDCDAAQIGAVADSRLPLVSVVDAPLRAATERAPRNAPIAAPLGNPLTDPLRLAPAEADLLADAADGQFDEHSLVEAGLVACGASGRGLDFSRARFAAAADELRRTVAGIHDAKQRLQLVHQVLYGRLLRAYDAEATDLEQTLETGVYNCASATLLFVALGQALDLKVSAVELPGHVRAVADCDGSPFEIELTCPNWSDAISRPLSDAGLTARTTTTGARVANLSPSGFENLPRRRVSHAGLVAMIYYNRGIDAFYEGRYGDAVAENRRALLLDPANPVARGNLLAAVNNWALALGDEGNFEAAEALLAAGLRFAPDHRPFAHNAAHVEGLRSKASR